MRAPIVWWAALLATAAVVAPSVSAQAAEDNVCRLHAPLQPTRLLRRTALALLGRVPSIDEYHQVEHLKPGSDEFSAVLDSWFESDEYRDQMRRYHMQLLWANPDGVTLRDGNMLLTRVSDGNGGFIWRLPSVAMRRAYRGGTGLHECQPVPQTTLEPGYTFGAKPFCEPQGNDAAGPYCQEGYVEVNPYWAPQTTIKVCAFDAQTAETFEYTREKDVNAGTYRCDDWQARTLDQSTAPGAQRVDSCGCGPDLDYCMATGGSVNTDLVVTGAMRGQMLRLVDDYTRGQAPYSELLTTKRSYLNGPLTHFLRYHAPMASPGRTHNQVHDDVPLPDIPWTDDNWYPLERKDLHAGLLTMPAYLLRYQTNRGRANRFRIAFMGQYFVPSKTATPGCVEDTEDVTNKCYCAGCHVTLEPMSMYFGSFAEAGSSSLLYLQKEFADDPATSIAEDYYDCAYQWLPRGFSLCNRLYKRIEVEDPNDAEKTIRVRRLAALAFADDHPSFEENFDKGPGELLVDHAFKQLNGKEYSFFAWATVRHLFQFLVGRELDVDPLSPDNEQELLDTLALSFESSDYNFRQLAKTIVTLPTFRRMP